MLPADTFNQLFTGLGQYEAFQALKEYPPAVVYTDHQDHVRTVPSEPREQSLPSRKHDCVSLTLMAHQFVNLPRFKIQQMITPIATCLS